MPAHIGFLETFKMGLNSLTTNISPSSTSRRARSALASQRQNLRGQAQGLAVGVPDPVQQFGDSLLSLSDVQNRLERNRSGREHRCDLYEAYRSYLDNRSPYLERERNATVHADYQQFSFCRGRRFGGVKSAKPKVQNLPGQPR